METDLDLAEAIEAATEAISASADASREHGQKCPMWTRRAKQPPYTSCDCWYLPQARAKAKTMVEAARPHIERAVREQVAKDIEALSDGAEVWSGNEERAYLEAAAIARGESSVSTAKAVDHDA